MTVEETIRNLYKTTVVTNKTICGFWLEASEAGLFIKSDSTELTYLQPSQNRGFLHLFELLDLSGYSPSEIKYINRSAESKRKFLSRTKKEEGRQQLRSCLEMDAYIDRHSVPPEPAWGSLYGSPTTAHSVAW